jgi:anti-anti-sigma factor
MLHKEEPVVKVTRENNRAEVRPEGDVVATVADELRTELKRLVGDGVSDLAIDLKGVEAIDSIGIGLLISTHNTLLKTGGGLSILNVSPDIYHLLKTMRLDRHFTVVGA